ncbi:hypothetical protein [Frateuria defendens]|uniref:hypothetical protein n=1 Tax=Frateuria defendens TaxID=2219559 RepID=UPI001293F2D9|nr:hypothetical protein [Frateuria defendens]
MEPTWLVARKARSYTQRPMRFGGKEGGLRDAVHAGERFRIGTALRFRAAS